MSIEMHPAHLAAEKAVRFLVSQLITRYYVTDKFARTAITVEVDYETFYEIRSNIIYHIYDNAPDDSGVFTLAGIRFYVLRKIKGGQPWRVISPLDRD